MMAKLTWAEIRTLVRRTFLKDTVADEETGEYRWSNDELRDCCWMALATFAQHTAVAAASVFPITRDTCEVVLPDNLLSCEPFDLNGHVTIVDGPHVRYLDPIRYTDGLKPNTAEGFYTYPNETLHFNFVDLPSDEAECRIRYYADYTRPVLDEDTVDIPHWGITALAYLITAHALSGVGLKTAMIRQYGAKPDTGNPEDNPVQKQQEWFFRQYEIEMSKHTPQERVQYSREATDY